MLKSDAGEKQSAEKRCLLGERTTARHINSQDLKPPAAAEAETNSSKQSKGKEKKSFLWDEPRPLLQLNIPLAGISYSGEVKDSSGSCSLPFGNNGGAAKKPPFACT